MTWIFPDSSPYLQSVSVACRPSFQVLQILPSLRPPNPATVFSQLNDCSCLSPGLPASTPAFANPFSCQQPVSLPVPVTLLIPCPLRGSLPPSDPRAHLLRCRPLSPLCSASHSLRSCQVGASSVPLNAKFFSSSVQPFPLSDTVPPTLLVEGPSPTSGLSKNVPPQRSLFPDHPFTVASSPLSPSQYVFISC